MNTGQVQLQKISTSGRPFEEISSKLQCSLPFTSINAMLGAVAPACAVFWNSRRIMVLLALNIFQLNADFMSMSGGNSTVEIAFKSFMTKIRVQGRAESILRMPKAINNIAEAAKIRTLLNTDCISVLCSQLPCPVLTSKSSSHCLFVD